MNVGDSAASSRGGVTGASAFFPSTGEPIRPTIRPERFSDPTNFSYQTYNQNINSTPKGNQVASMSQNFQTIEQSKKQQKSDSTLQAFDPLVPSKSVETLTDSELNVNVSTGIGGSTQTLVPENMALSPDQGFVSPGAHSEHSHFETTSAGASHGNRDSGLPSESASLDTISEDLGGLKLTEQQNVHIDAQRLSTAGLSLFDPLSQESSTDPDETETPPVRFPLAAAPTKPSFNDQGGVRPKAAANNLPAMTPRISVQSSDQEGPVSADGTMRQSDTVRGADGDNVSMHSTDSASRFAHRGSTDSSNSSLIDISSPRAQKPDVSELN